MNRDIWRYISVILPSFQKRPCQGPGVILHQGFLISKILLFTFNVSVSALTYHPANAEKSLVLLAKMAFRASWTSNSSRTAPKLRGVLLLASLYHGGIDNRKIAREIARRTHNTYSSPSDSPSTPQNPADSTPQTAHGFSQSATQ